MLPKLMPILREHGEKDPPVGQYITGLESPAVGIRFLKIKGAGEVGIYLPLHKEGCGTKPWLIWGNLSP